MKAWDEADREFDKRKKKPVQEEKKCFRCGESGWTKEHNKICKARKHPCKTCGKTVHLEKLRKRNKKGKEKVKRIDGDDESTELESTDSDSSDSEEISRVVEEKRYSGRVHRVTETNRERERLPVRRVRMNGKTSRTSGYEFEFMLRVKGRKIAASLDTGSPISIMPRNFSKVVRPKKRIRRESSRKFVDVNGRPIPITNRYKVITEMNGTEKPKIWWEVETNTKPIIGIDNFDKLGLQLIQRPTSEKALTNSGRRNQGKRINQECDQEEKQSNRDCETENPIGQTKIDELKRRIKEKFRKLFQVNKTVKNFEYDVQFKPSMELKQHRGRRIPIHMQMAVETELEKDARCKKGT